MEALIAALRLLGELFGALRACLELKHSGKEASDSRRPRHLKK